jgi:hypothetical protein
MAAPRAVRIELSEAERVELAARLRRRKVARGDAVRAEIVLPAAEGLSNLAIVERLGVARMTVATWRRRFAERRLDGLLDEPRPGAPRTVACRGTGRPSSAASSTPSRRACRRTSTSTS